jgi:hypothetical protein
MRALMRQVVVRFYPSDVDRSVVIRVFAPYLVARDPSPDAPDSMDRDRSFALKMSGNVWEHWERDGEIWRCQWVDAEGKELAEHPFRPTQGVSPYPRIPVQIVYDDFAGGRDWLPPRQSRSTWMEALNAQSNDLWALITHEAHTQRYVSTNDPTGLPKHIGPDEMLVTPADATIGVLQYSPKIRESQDTITANVRLMLFGEDLPISEFDDAKQVVTGAALKVQSRPLIDRREAQVLLAESDERSAWSRFRGVHNVHASEWGVDVLATDTEIELEVAPLEIPEDESRLLDTDSKAITMHARSVIDVIQRLHLCNRDAAIEIYRRIEKDNEEFRVSTPDLESSPVVDGRSGAQTPSELPVDIEEMAEPTEPAGEGVERMDSNEPSEVASAAQTQAVALNGAQVTSALEIVTAVASRGLPRSTGVEMLVAFFGLTREVAESVMGDVGQSFFVQFQDVAAAAESLLTNQPNNV